MVRTHTTRKGQRHTYYRCDQGREKHGNKCSQKPVRAAGIENLLVAHLQSTVGGDLSGLIVQRVLARVIYDGSTQCAAVWFRDGSRSQIRVPELHRPGLGSGHTVTQRVPRVTRLLALAIKLERAVREGSVEKHRDLAEVGQISRPRMSQIMNLTNLAPKIQEELLFLPATRTGPDVITERDLRAIVKVVDWEWQMKLFRQVMDSAGA